MKLINTSRTNFFKGLLFKTKISGESCWPNLVPGKIYWASSAAKPKAGDFVVFRHPRPPQQTYVKKIRTVHAAGYEVEGTVSWSDSSRVFGLVPKKNILGKILFPD